MGSLFPYIENKDSDQTEQMPRLVEIFAGHTDYLLF